ncbi:Asp23/Gls24 family envelope stress response protein [Anaeroselena agilis]|uniref:Asp23/Gls24 family envelope stress response protein n=1 Tax=Anaeroselena agilis TaxID=3063788 RepID=A0ABU3NYM9_9FIRM|nr:Asp23/Gls24 family envelope stress response protein [Selenomonadales bacterium 4137-cl]
MEVIALVGPSGTGKSHRALIVAHDHNVDGIIDDGLLIKDSKIIAGRSAKKEPSKIRAVKRAIFMEPDHAEEVRRGIESIRPKRLLILGTSRNMVNKIVDTLHLPPVSKVINIEDIASKQEIAKARESRAKEGRHIIPVPTIELKPYFSGYLIDPLEIFFKKPQSAAKRRKLGEKSIVRPTFSYYGKLFIADAAIAAIVDNVATSDLSITRTGQVHIKNSQDREKGISISLDVTIKYGLPLRDILLNAQQRIKNMVEYMTGMMVKDVNIEVRRLSID